MKTKQKQLESTPQERLATAVKAVQDVLSEHQMTIVVVGFKIVDGRVYPEVHLQPVQQQPPTTNQTTPVT